MSKRDESALNRSSARAKRWLAKRAVAEAERSAIDYLMSDAWWTDSNARSCNVLTKLRNAIESARRALEEAQQP